MKKCHSSIVKAALKKINDLRGKTLSEEERELEAIDLAALMLEEAIHVQTKREKAQQEQLARMMQDPKGKAFTTDMTDQCFRSSSPYRVAKQLLYLLKVLGVPKYLNWIKRCQLHLFRIFGLFFAPLLIPLVTFMLRKETSSVILPGEPLTLAAHIQKRKKQGVRININHLGEAILGETEAKKRLGIYLEDLTKPEIEYVSIKISTIYSQINLLAWDNTLSILSERLKQLYRAAITNCFTKTDGTLSPKFVNLDMEEYRDLHLTKELFMNVLD